MTAASVPLPRSERVGALRADFDRSFSLPPAQDADLLDVLALRIGDEACTMRLLEIAEVVARPALTAVPALVPALLGLTVSRGHVVAAYDLSALLGGAPAEPRWLVVPACEPEVGLTFGTFDGYRQLPPDQTGTARLMSLPSIVAAIRAHSPDPATAATAVPQHDPSHRSGDR